MLAKLVSRSGYASILGGVLFAIYVVFHPLRDGIDMAHLGNTYGAIHMIGVFGLVFQLLGLVGLYVQYADSLGTRGLTSFIVAFFGQIFYIGLTVLDGIRNPLLARYDPAAVHTPADNDPNLLLVVGIALLLFFVGYALFGSSLLSAKSLPRLASWFIMIGGPLYIIGGINIFTLGPASPVISYIEIAGAIPFSIGYVLLGLKQISGMGRKVAQTALSHGPLVTG